MGQHSGKCPAAGYFLLHNEFFAIEAFAAYHQIFFEVNRRWIPAKAIMLWSFQVVSVPFFEPCQIYMIDKALIYADSAVCPC